MSAPRRIVVVGTGTGIGKTWLSCALLRRLRATDRHALGLKPVESGVSPGTETDARLLAVAAGQDYGRDDDALRSNSAPYRLAEPISPHLAARYAGSTIDLALALRYVQSQESSGAATGPAVTLIETAGGLFSPLAPGITNFDLARALEPATWLLVAPDALGVLHDVTATLGFARSLGRPPDAIALSRARPADASTGTNAAEIAGLGIGPKPSVFPDDGDDGLDSLLRVLLP